MALLRVVRGLNPGQVFVLSSESVILGRNPSCDIVLDVGAVSRQHARIFRRGDDFYIEDLNSRNKTYLNDRTVEAPTKLAENDRVRICDMEFVFHLGPPIAGSNYGHDETVANAVLMDEERPGSTSTIMSRVDISSGTSGLRITVKPEVKLKALLEITQKLARAVSLNEVLPKVLDSLFSIFVQADRGFIVLRDPKTGRLIPKAVKQRRESHDAPIRISRTILNGVIGSKEAILSADAATDSRFDMAESIVDFHIHSMMCAPLVSSGGEVLGAIQIDTTDQRQRFNQEDLEVLASVACQAAIAVENAQLHEIALQQAEIRRDLANAQRLQQGFLPAAPPGLPGYRFFDFYDPARELGGDYFAYVQLPQERLAVVVADVSGKGFSASLLVARLSAETPQLLLTEPTAAAALARLNDVFCESRWEDRFVTMVVVVLDPSAQQIEIASAGHLPVLRCALGGRLEIIGEQVTGLPLGVVPGAEYQSQTFPFDPGHTVVLYTDGIVEAMNAQRDLYGMERLESLLKRTEPDPRVLGEQIINDVRNFVGDHPQSDDMCLVCVGREGE